MEWENPFEFFDKIYCINLDTRKDRWEECLKEFKKLYIENLVERFPAYKLKDSRAGCNLSHITLIKKAKEDKLNNVLILEDDVKFINNTLLNLKKCIYEIEEKKIDWDAWYLGANTHNKLNKITNHLYELKNGFAAHSIAYNKKSYDYILKNYKWKKFVESPHDMYDVWLTNLQNDKRVIVSSPILTTQRESFSDIEKRKVNYKFIEERAKQNLK